MLLYAKSFHLLSNDINSADNHANSIKADQLKLVTERVRVKKENIAGFSQHMKETRHKQQWEKMEIIHYENNWKKKTFREAVIITFYKKIN